MTESVTSQSQAHDQPEARQDAAMLELKKSIFDGIYFEAKWWGYHLHFTYQAMQALIAAGGDDIVDLVTEAVKAAMGKLPLVSELVGLTIQLRWMAMKEISASTKDGVRLTSPWIAVLMLIPMPRRSVPADRLWWMVYGDPQESFVFNERGEPFVFADPGETPVIDAAGGA